MRYHHELSIIILMPPKYFFLTYQFILHQLIFFGWFNSRKTKQQFRFFYYLFYPFSLLQFHSCNQVQIQFITPKDFTARWLIRYKLQPRPVGPGFDSTNSGSFARLSQRLLELVAKHKLKMINGNGCNINSFSPDSINRHILTPHNPLTIAWPWHYLWKLKNALHCFPNN